MSSITVGVYLGKKDRLVRYWYEILPKGQFPMLVKYCIQSYLRNNYFPLQSICDPRSLKEQIQMRGDYVPTQRNVTFTPEDGPVYQWIKSLESGYRSEEIKNILKETVVHTLLNDQPLFPPRSIGQAPYNTVESHESQGTYHPYPEEAQKVTMLKRDQVQLEEPYSSELEVKEKASKGFSHLVNYLG
ncbi:hypothetical protein ACFO25_11015 [Paenactinomyces guangxiensis]|uniref:Uncharacterized protein n=1 Tax=Paenactinomyces guangxiensis TaxID=1490290 RepID=A0A7W2A8E2_9BACL|nr:hypothetical protein [Paenactinomyces guangxiensis]MBA4494074.1 hypothetical protein [Paenactinomyces guangxiensis]MBH8591181.1 hypothetical protein [Paenactinomyces guangxiensis]